MYLWILYSIIRQIAVWKVSLKNEHWSTTTLIWELRGVCTAKFGSFELHLLSLFHVVLLARHDAHSFKVSYPCFIYYFTYTNMFLSPFLVQITSPF